MGEGIREKREGRDRTRVEHLDHEQSFSPVGHSVCHTQKEEVGIEFSSHLLQSTIFMETCKRKNKRFGLQIVQILLNDAGCFCCSIFVFNR